MVEGQRTASSTKASASNNQTTTNENHQYNFIRNSHASHSDKSGNIPSCAGCSTVIGKEVKALQCDNCSSLQSWKCSEYLDLDPGVYDALMSDQGCELKWFCNTCDDRIMKESDKLQEIVKLLTLLMTKTDQIETAVKEKVDTAALNDISKRITSAEDTSRKLLHSNQDLQTQQ